MHKGMVSSKYEYSLVLIRIIYELISDIYPYMYIVCRKQ